MLAFFSLGIPAMTAWQIATRAFYALQDTITPLKVGFIQIAIDIALLLTLPRIMGYRGLPLATAISISIGFVILWWILCLSLPEIREEKLFYNFLKSLVMCLVQAISLYILIRYLKITHDSNRIKELLYAMLSGGVSFLLYIFTGYLIKYPHISNLFRVKLLKLKN
jgi:putative peptidoglycan lipid II flippase